MADLAWADRVRRNREQVERFREEPDGRDFYAKVSSIFRDDPDRAGDPVLEALLAHARPDDTWLDIGAGAGRYALPLARAVRMVIALDPSPSMLDGLREAMAEHRIDNVEVVQGRWPGAEQGSGPSAAALPADVTLIAHVGYDVDAIWPFLEAMERVDPPRVPRGPHGAQSGDARGTVLAPKSTGSRESRSRPCPRFVDLLAAHGRTAEVRCSSRAGGAGAARRGRDVRQPPDVGRARLGEGPPDAGAHRRVARQARGRLGRARDDGATVGGPVAWRPA